VAGGFGKDFHWTRLSRANDRIRVSKNSAKADPPRIERIEGAKKFKSQIACRGKNT
jgi:hypothetical protein